MKKIIRSVPFFYFIRNIYTRWAQRKEFNKWIKEGKNGASPHKLKQEVIRKFSKQHNLKVLIETGTYVGDMIEAMKNNFESIYSIELDKDLYSRAKKRFINQKKINLSQGDSSMVMERIVPLLDSPALFWLDGHYSGGITAKGEKISPILEELTVILNGNHLQHVLLIDDARLFGNDSGYPSIEQVSELIKEKRPKSTISIKDDIIRVFIN